MEVKTVDSPAEPALARFEWGAGADRVTVGDVMTRAVAAGIVTEDQRLGLLVRELEREEPPRIERVLACVRDDARQQAVVSSALELARRHRAPLTVLLVLTTLVPPRLDGGAPARLLEPIAAWRCHQARARLAQLVPAAAEVNAATVVVVGSVTREALRSAGECRADLIVTDRDAARWLMRDAPCPVLAVA